MSLIRLTRIRRNFDLYFGRNHDYNEWDSLPPIKLQNKNVIPKVEARTAVKHDVKMRGTGIHGPERVEVLKLALWNKLKHFRLQREVPTVEELKFHHRMEVSYFWFGWGMILFFYPMIIYGSKYAMKHGHHPWVPKRTDGTLGEGTMTWLNL